MSKWLFRYNPYLQEGEPWDSKKRLLWIKEVVPSDTITVTSLYEITIEAVDSVDAERRALAFIEEKKPLPSPNYKEVALFLEKLTGETWAWGFHEKSWLWKFSSPTVFGISIKAVSKTDTLWTFFGLFDPKNYPTEKCEMLVSIGTDSETIALLIKEQMLPIYREFQTSAIQKIKEREEQYSKDCLLFWNVVAPLRGIEHKVQANTYCFHDDSVGGTVSVDSPGGIRFEDLTVPFDVAEKIITILSQQIK